uniref:Uncharacterized protein n=1 Tax=Anguilla anguilla TaxID=7936 RepID=A0A0E9XTL1_ANGAN
MVSIGHISYRHLHGNEALTVMTSLLIICSL